jgi:FkbM family methyltransferase
MLIPFDTLVQRYSLAITGVLHVGAHAGEENDAYRKMGVPQSSIYWVEAIPDLATALSARLPNVIQAVVSNTEEPVVFRITNNGQSSSILPLKEHRREHPDIHVVKEVSMQTVPLDTLVDTHSIRANFLNMDIQGAELKCLQGFERHIHEVDYVYTEVNTKELYEGCAQLLEMDIWLDAHGFERKEITMTPHGWGDAFYMRRSK